MRNRWPSPICVGQLSRYIYKYKFIQKATFSILPPILKMHNFTDMFPIYNGTKQKCGERNAYIHGAKELIEILCVAFLCSF